MEVGAVGCAGRRDSILQCGCTRYGERDGRWLVIRCGVHLGRQRICGCIGPGGGCLGGGAALCVLNFVIGGLIGGFVLVWRLLVAVWYVPLTIYRLIVGH